MGAVSKLIIGIAGIIFGIIVIAVIVPAQMQQQQVTKNLIQQDVSQLNNVDVKLISDCQTFQSVADLTGCKTQISSLKTDCQTSPYSSMAVCGDPRIDQFLSTVDSKIAYAQNVISMDTAELNTVYLKMLDQCSAVNDSSTLSSCKTMIMQMQDTCSSMGSNQGPACNDPRIGQILNKQISPPSNVYDAASQNMESFINLCMISQDSSAIQDCATKARQMISLCQSTTVQACSDPRLQQIANMGQEANDTAPQPAGQAVANVTAFASTNTTIESILNECTNSTISNSPVCTNGLITLKQDCQGPLKPYLSYVPACNDPRLK